MKRKNLVLMDIFLIAGLGICVLGTISYFVFSEGMRFSPPDDLARSSVLFRFEGEKLLVCKDVINCAEPRDYLLSDGQTIELRKGEYYFIILKENYREVRPIDLRVNSVFVLEKQEDGSYYVVNGGQDLYVTVQGAQGEQSSSLIFEGGEDE